MTKSLMKNNGRNIISRIIMIFFCLLFLMNLFSCDLKSSEYYNSEAEKLEAIGNFNDAILLLDKALEKDPENVYALINRGVDKSILEDYEGAIEDYSKIIEINPDNTLAYLNRGKNKKRIEDFVGAIEDFDKAIKTKGGEFIYMDKVENSFVETGYEFDVKMEEIRFERGLARIYINETKTAFEDFNFCIQQNYEVSTCYYYIGRIYIIYGMIDDACDALNKALELGDTDAQEIIEKHCEK